jgi:hypothetical protein
MSASFDSPSEDVRGFTVVIPELEFGNIEREIFFADLVERPDRGALDERPESFDGLSVDNASDVLSAGMVDGPHQDNRLT